MGLVGDLFSSSHSQLRRMPWKDYLTSPEVEKGIKRVTELVQEIESIQEQQQRAKTGQLDL